MEFVLKQFDRPLVEFSATMDTKEPEIEILWTTGDLQFLPLDLHLTEGGLAQWLKRRTIPKNRAFVHELLSKQGLSLNRPMGILMTCKGLSLNDCYWVTTKGDNSKFASVNLYDNPLSRTLAQIAFTGYGSQNRSFLSSSPELTTNGMLPKCWRRDRGTISLWKGGTSMASNAGFEPYSEFYAAQIGEIMGLNIVKYNLSKWKGQLCSTCPLFTSQGQSFLPIGHLVTKGGMDGVKEYYKSLGDDFAHALEDLLVFDAIICNVDRHFGNFGLLIDNRTNQIVAPAPLFDHGNSLFNFAGTDYWGSDADLERYIDTLTPAVYDDFIGTARKNLRHDHRDGLRKLLDFHFKKHPMHNLPATRLKMIEQQIQKRVKDILE